MNKFIELEVIYAECDSEKMDFKSKNILINAEFIIGCSVLAVPELENRNHEEKFKRIAGGCIFLDDKGFYFIKEFLNEYFYSLKDEKENSTLEILGGENYIFVTLDSYTKMKNELGIIRGK